MSKVCNVKPEEKKNYTVSKVWVSNKNLSLSDAEEEVWPEGSYTEFDAQDVLSSNKTPTEIPKEITISDPSFIRFWYAPKDKEKNYDVDFYDYDITDGNWCSEEQGINSPGNYVNADGTQSDKKTDRLGVGQPSAGNLSSWAETAALQVEGADDFGRTINKQTPKNLSNGKQKLVTQDIVGSELTDADGDGKPDADGELQYNVTAPKNLFSTDGTGTTQYTNYQLGFKQKGDTYTLDNVYDTGKKEPVESNLSEMIFMSEKWVPPSWTGPKPYVFSNNFWPLDNVPEEKRNDELIGNKDANGEDQKYTFKKQDGTEKSIGIVNDDQKNYSDTEGPHNYYFGMKYSVDFTIGDYTGPMEYYFRGDDDFWLFIDGKLVVDIGGIHQVASHSVDLRAKMTELGIITYEDGILQNKNEKHTMKIFYMERGATGSCCYMQFSLPNSEPVTIPEPETTTYKVTKNWADNGNPFRPGEVTVELQQILNGRTENTGKTVTLSANSTPPWTYEWTGLPKINGSSKGEYEYSYTVKEINLPSGYKSEVDKDTGQLTNSLVPIKVEVEKIWQNDEDLKDYRPKSITLQLYANGEVYEDTYESETKQPRRITLNEGNKWKGTFDNLPEYYYRLENGEYSAYSVRYSVREIDTNGSVISNGGYLTTEKGVKYKVTYDPDVTSVPTASRPQKVPVFNGAVGEMTEVEDESYEGDELGNNNTEITEDSVDGEAADSGYGEDSAVLEGEVYNDAYRDIDIDEVNADAFFPVAYSAQRNTPITGTGAANGEQRTVAKLTVTNTLVKNFKILKKDSSDKTTGKTTPLSGAEFKLTLCNADGTPAEGNTGTLTSITSDEKGTLNLKWEELQAGSYYLMEETKAPAGYMLSRVKWIIQIVENFKMKEIGEVKSFEDYSADHPEVPNTKPVSVNSVDSADNTDGLVLSYTFYNDEIYKLPNTGSTGIYWYTISGMLLMMGASLILYKNRRKKAIRG